MRFLLVVVGMVLLAGCSRVSGPLKLYFISSPRFTSGNRAGVLSGDTLATSLYAVADSSASQPGNLTRFRAVVTYMPRRQPFAYPVLPGSIVKPPNDPEIVYLDTVLTRKDFLFTPVFGARTTSGSENWTFTASDAAGNSSARSFILVVRYTDSLKLYHDYTLKLRVPANRKSDRRFIDLKSGLALPAYSVVGQVPNSDLQKLTDLIVLPDGLGLVSPDSAGARLDARRWPTGNRSQTRFRLTTLLPADFTGAQDVNTIQNQFAGAGRASIRTLALNQVYAFRVYQPDKTTAVYGLMLVKNLPNGTTTTGLQLEIRLAKQAL